MAKLFEVKGGGEWRKIQHGLSQHKWQVSPVDQYSDLETAIQVRDFECEALDP